MSDKRFTTVQLRRMTGYARDSPVLKILYKENRETSGNELYRKKLWEQIPEQVKLSAKPATDQLVRHAEGDANSNNLEAME